MDSSVAHSGVLAGMTSHPPERFGKIDVLFSSRRLFVLSIFKLKFDDKYESIPSKFECLHKYI